MHFTTQRLHHLYQFRFREARGYFLHYGHTVVDVPLQIIVRNMKSLGQHSTGMSQHPVIYLLLSRDRHEKSGGSWKPFIWSGRLASNRHSITPPL